MSNDIDRQKLFNAIGELSREEGADSEGVTRALKKGDVSGVMSSLPDDAANQLRTVLNDKNKMKELLSSPEAARLIKLFGKGSKG